MESGLLHALRKSGLELVDSGDLAEMESAGTSLIAARDLDADYVLAVRIVARRKKLRAEARLIATKDGETVWSARRSYARKRQAWMTGRALGSLAVRELGTLRAKLGPVVPPERAARVESEPAEETAAIAELDPPSDARAHPEDAIFRAALFAGSQLSSAYTVSVGGQSTGLAYELHPAALVAGELVLSLPWLPLSVEASIAYVPMFYDIDVDPAVTPDQPGARHLDLAASLGYGFRVWLFEARPLIGLTYRSLAVQKQEPIDVLVGADSIAPHVGLRASIRAGDVVMEAKGLFRLIVSYRETPDSTGESAFGTSYLVGAAARYWITDFLAAYADVAYDFTRIGFDGAGTRVEFAGDPELVDATIHAAEIRAALGVAFAL